MFEIKKEFSFSASHQLRGLPEDHPCSRLHGHNYTVVVRLKAQFLDEIGFVKDYRELGCVKRWLDENFDHRNLNDHFAFKKVNPTAEHLALFIYTNFSKSLPQMFAVTVKETDKTSATYEPKA